MICLLSCLCFQQKYPAFIYNMCLGYTRTRTTQVRVKGEERIKNLLLEGTTPLSSLTTAALIDSIPKKTIQQMRAVPGINRAMPPPTSSSTRKPTRQAETSKGDTGADGEAPRKRGRPRKGESPKMADKNKAKAVTKKYTAPQGYTEREQEVMSKLEELQIPVVNDLQVRPNISNDDSQKVRLTTSMLRTQASNSSRALHQTCMVCRLECARISRWACLPRLACDRWRQDRPIPCSTQWAWNSACVLKRMVWTHCRKSYPPLS